MNTKLLACALLAFNVSVVHADVPPAYDFTFIRIIDDPTDINNAGQVVGGGGRTGTLNHAFLWEAGRTTFLDRNPSEANGINNLGQVVGSTWPRPPDLYEETTAMSWTKISSTMLNHLEPNGRSEALAINDHGVAVGFSTVGPIDIRNDPDGAHNRVPVVWNGQTPTRLSNPEAVGGVVVEGMEATDINNHGQIVGRGGIRNEGGGFLTYHALMWDGDKVVDLDPGDYVSGAAAINDAGQVVGTSSLREPDGSHFRMHAFLWDDGVATDLGALDPYQYSGANDINNNGEIVGYSILSGNDYATLWDQNGKIYDLNSFLDTEEVKAGWVLTNAVAINDLGQILGFAENTSPGLFTRGSFLLTPTPIPEPESYAMLAAGLGVIGFVARRRKCSAVPNLRL